VRILKMQILSGNQSVQEALKYIQLPGQSVLAEYRDEIRLIKASQLHRVSRGDRGEIKLKDLPWESSEAVYLASDAQVGLHRIQVAGDQLSGDPFGLITSLGRRLALVRSGGMNYVISASEDFLVDYHCDPDNHPWYPPPQWSENTKCWCKLPVKRDG
jgi:hypothetical protein